MRRAARAAALSSYVCAWQVLPGQQERPEVVAVQPQPGLVAVPAVRTARPMQDLRVHTIMPSPTM
jgi:hypothetical protein